MTKENLHRALANCETFTEWVLVAVAGLPTPFSFIACACVLGGVFVAGLLF